MKNLDLIKTQTEFINSLEFAGKSFNTLKNYKTDLNIFNQFLKSKGRELSLNEITTPQIKEYSSFLNDKYNSPNSIRRRVQALRMYFDYLISQELIEENPIKKILVSPKVVDIPNPFPFHMVTKVIQHLISQRDSLGFKGHSALLVQRNLLLIHLIYGAGLKVSDIERLHLSHITLTNNKYRVLVAPIKRDPYTVSLDPGFNEVYEGYLQLLNTQKNKDKIYFENLLFNANPFKILKGGLSARGIEVIFKELSKSFDHKLTAKNLRQSCIFKWLTKGTPESRIKEWMSVQPKYSLSPYKELLAENPNEFTFMELS